MEKVMQWIPTPAPILDVITDKSFAEWLENGQTKNFWDLIGREHDNMVHDKFMEIIEDCREQMMEFPEIMVIYNKAANQVENNENEAAWERSQEFLLEDGGSHHDISHKLNQARKLK